jgi:hypothetical protein
MAPSCASRNSKAMDDLHDLVLAMFGMAVAAVMLVAGELYLVTRPDPSEINSKPRPVVTSSAEQQPWKRSAIQSGSAPSPSRG